MNIYLVVDDWRRHGKSVYSTEAGVQLSMGDFHSGTTFPGTIELDEEDAAELRRALRDGFQPVFWILEAKHVVTKEDVRNRSTMQGSTRYQ